MKWYTSTFTPKDRATHGKYAAKNENVKAIRKYVVGEGTIELFKNYLAARRPKHRLEQWKK